MNFNIMSSKLRILHGNFATSMIYYVDRVEKSKRNYACINFVLTLRPAVHEDEVIYEVNIRNPNGRRIARVSKKRSNSDINIKVKGVKIMLA